MKKYKKYKKYKWKDFRVFFQLGFFLFVLAFSYWMFEADLVWDYFIKNIKIALNIDLSPDLVPTRFFQSGLSDQVLIGLFFHARDLILFSLAALGLGFLIVKPNLPEKTLRGYILLSLFWTASATIFSLSLLSDLEPKDTEGFSFSRFLSARRSRVYFFGDLESLSISLIKN